MDVKARRYVVLRQRGAGGRRPVVAGLSSTGTAPPVVSPADVPLTDAPPGDPDVPGAVVGASTWAHTLLGVDPAAATGRGVTVAVLDSGCDLTHPCFAHLVARGAVVAESLLRDASSALDEDGHGTAMASLIAGGVVDGAQVGVAPGVSRLLIGRVMRGGEARLDDVARGVSWAVSLGATVVVVPLGVDHLRHVERLTRDGYHPREALAVAFREHADALRRFERLAALVALQGALLVACTGNDAAQPRLPLGARVPGAARGVIAVGATWGSTREALRLARYSNGGADVVAPGSDLLAAEPGGRMGKARGTSAATALVGGVAALWAERLRADLGVAPPELLRAKLLGHAVPLRDAPFASAGAGLVQAPSAPVGPQRRGGAPW